jgi:predicted ATPase
MGQAIDTITLKGFKSIQSLENFPLAPLNVLIGANGSGKGTAAMRRTGSVRDNERFRPDAGNLAAFLFKLREEKKDTL